MRGSTVGFLFDANTVAMLMSPNHAVTRLGKLLLSRMKRNSRSALAEVWDAESAFAEPDAELVEHPIVWFSNLAGVLALAVEVGHLCLRVDQYSPRTLGRIARLSST